MSAEVRAAPTAGPSAEETPAGAANLIDASLVAASAALVAVLGGFRLGAPSLWLDEVWTRVLTSPPTGDLVSVLTAPDVSAPLYYLLMWAWGPLAGAEVGLRAPSVVFAVVAVPVFWLLARELVDLATARVAVVLFAVNGMVLTWAREARGYTLALLLATACSYLFVRALREPTGRRWTAWSVLAALGVYAHPFSALVLLAQGGVVLPRLSEAALRRSVLRAGALLALLLLPLLWFIAGSSGEQVGWIPPLGRDTFRQLAQEFAGTRSLVRAVPAVVLLFIGGTLTALGSRRSRSVSRTADAFLLAWLLVPILVLAAVSLLQPLLAPRYLIVVIPAAVLLVARGSTSFGRPAVGGALAIAIIAVASWPTTVQRYDTEGREDWRSAVAIVTAGWRDGDVVVVEPEVWRVAFAYYATRSHEPGAQPIRLVGEPYEREDELGPAAEYTSDAASAPRVWYLAVAGFDSFDEIHASGGAAAPAGFESWSVESWWRPYRVAVVLLDVPTDAEGLEEGARS